MLAVVVELALLLAYIPVQALGQAVEPVAYLILGANGRHRVNGGGHPKAIYACQQKRKEIKRKKV